MIPVDSCPEAGEKVVRRLAEAVSVVAGLLEEYDLSGLVGVAVSGGTVEILYLRTVIRRDRTVFIGRAVSRCDCINVLYKYHRQSSIPGYVSPTEFEVMSWRAV